MPNVQRVAYGRPLIEEIGRAVLAAKGSDPLAPVTVIVPHNVAGIHMRRRLAEGAVGLLNVRFTTVRALARLLAEDALGGKASLAPVAATMAVRRALQEVESPLTKLADHPGTVARVTRTLTELRREKPGWEASLPESHRFLASFYARWRALLEPAFADEQDLLDAALAAWDTRQDLVASWGGRVLFLPPTGDFRRDAFAALLADGAVATVDAETTPPEARRCVLLMDAAEEARYVVAEVARAAAEGVRLDRMAVASANPDDYAFWIEAYARSAGIPVHGTASRRLGDGPVGRALRGLLTLDPRLERHELLNWWASAPMSFSGQAISVPDWDRLSRNAGVTRGLAAWRRAGSLDDGARLVQAVEALSRLLAGPEVDSWPAWSEWARQALETWVDPDALEPNASEEGALIRERLAGLVDLARLEPKVGRTGFRQAVEEMLREAVPPKTRYGSGVFFGRLSAFQGLDFDRVFVLGMHEGGLPGKEGEDPVFPLETRPEALRHSRLQAAREAYETARSSAPNVTFVASRIDRARQRERLPSAWWLEEASDLHGRPVFSTDLGQLRDAPWLVYPESLPASLKAGTLADLRDRDLIDLVEGADPSSHPLAQDRSFRAAVRLLAARRLNDLTEFDGVTEAPFPADRPITISASVLEDLATCPHRYWLKHVLKVAETEEPEEIDAVAGDVRGRVIHEALRRYGERCMERGSVEETEMGAIADAVLAAAEAEGATGYPVLWQHLRKRLTQALMAFTGEDAEFRRGLGSKIQKAEYDFRDTTVGPFLVRGRIDRVDMGEDGLIVIDYKTGSLPPSLNKDPLNRGRLVQLALYAEALRAPHAAAYFIKLQLDSHDLWRFQEVPMTEEWRNRFRENLATFAKLVRDGAFPPRPDVGDGEGHCKFCAFNRLCASERAAIWARKRSDPRLVDLLKTETVIGNGGDDS